MLSMALEHLAFCTAELLDFSILFVLLQELSFKYITSLDCVVTSV